MRKIILQIVNWVRNELTANSAVFSTERKDLLMKPYSLDSSHLQCGLLLSSWDCLPLVALEGFGSYGKNLGVGMAALVTSIFEEHLVFLFFLFFTKEDLKFMREYAVCRNGGIIR